MPQVDKSHYDFEKYMSPSRWASYYYQIKEVLNCNPRSVLEVGIGDKVTGYFIRKQEKIEYTSLDFAEDLNPDVTGDVRDMPFEDDSFDVVCAFEVLEHLPFDDFEKALAELKRVTRHNVVISLPHFGPQVRFLLKIPLISLIRFATKIFYPKEHIFNGEHYWEIGKKGYHPTRIKTILQKYFVVEKEYVPFENQYHHFYVLRK